MRYRAKRLRFTVSLLGLFASGHPGKFELTPDAKGLTPKGSPAPTVIDAQIKRFRSCSDPAMHVIELLLTHPSWSEVEEGAEPEIVPTLTTLD